MAAWHRSDPSISSRRAHTGIPGKIRGGCVCRGHSRCCSGHASKVAISNPNDSTDSQETTAQSTKDLIGPLLSRFGAPGRDFDPPGYCDLATSRPPGHNRMAQNSSYNLLIALITHLHLKRIAKRAQKASSPDLAQRPPVWPRKGRPAACGDNYNFFLICSPSTYT